MGTLLYYIQGRSSNNEFFPYSILATRLLKKIERPKWEEASRNATSSISVDFVSRFVTCLIHGEFDKISSKGYDFAKVIL